MKWNLLVVTDHTTHSDSNSVYQLSQALRSDPRCGIVWVCSRGLKQNIDFFSGVDSAPIFATLVDDYFSFDVEGRYFHQSVISIDRNKVDTILVRIPQPADKAFLLSLESIVPSARIINSPAGILETSTKAFLLHVPHLCPEPIMCNSLQEALDLSMHREIVLKPLNSYGGRGIVRLSRDYCWDGNYKHRMQELASVLLEDMFPMLSMTFLKNVVKGDKRTIVVNGQIIGSALRLPAPGSWMCNVAQGGHAEVAYADEDELEIERVLTPILYQKGVVFYGFDTLVGDDGHRVLSEINTLSIGGLMPLQLMSGKPILTDIARLLWDYIENKKT